jgi:hypothetical protein
MADFSDLLSSFSSPGNDLAAGGALLGGVGSLVAGQANASADQTTAEGYGKEAALYNQAATQAGYDVGLIAAGGVTQQALMARRAQQIESTAGAAEAYGNLGAGGSAQYILQDSQRQAALAMGQTRTETQLQENQFAQMQTAYEAQAQGAIGAQQAAQKAASSAGTGGFLGLLGGIVGAGAKLFARP